jgi:hypothetical protein
MSRYGRQLEAVTHTYERGSGRAGHQCQMCEFSLKCGMETEPENSFNLVLLWKAPTQVLAPHGCGLSWQVLPRSLVPSMLVTPLSITKNLLGFGEFFQFVGSFEDYSIAALFFLKVLVIVCLLVNVELSPITDLFCPCLNIVSFGTAPFI